MNKNKLKQWVLPCFDDESEGIPPKQEKFPDSESTNQKEDDNNSKPTLKNNSLLSTISNAEDWMKNFEPKCVKDLAVHNNKIQEVESWLTNAVKSHSEMLLISGPVGSGKTSTVQMLAKKYNMRIREWITPLDTDFPSADGNFLYRDKQVNVFKKFLVDAGCYASLLQSNTNTLLLVEDYPNTLLRNPSQFVEALQHYKDRRASAPIVFICTECHSDNKENAYSMFTNAVKDQFKIHHITFNSISATGLKMALKRVAEIMCKKYSSVYSGPSLELQECVGNSSAGDVRSAVLNLHFAALKGVSTKPSKEKLIQKETKSRSKKKKDQSRFRAIGKDESVSLLHGVGRVLNPKWIKDGERRTLTHRPSNILEQLSSQPTTLLSFLHENYPPHFSDIEQAARASRYVSDADILLAEWREKLSSDYGLYVCVSGLMLANKTPVSAWHPVRGPKNAKITYLTSREIPLLEEDQLYKGRVLISDYKTHCNIIAASQRNKTLHENTFQT